MNDLVWKKIKFWQQYAYALIISSTSMEKFKHLKQKYQELSSEKLSYMYCINKWEAQWPHG